MLALFLFMAIVFYVVGRMSKRDGLCWLSVMVAALGLYILMMIV